MNNDNQFDELFDQTIPPANKNAKKLAINSAMSEFTQTLAQPTRPTNSQDNNQDNGFLNKIKSMMRFIATPHPKSHFGGAFASVAVVFIALSVFVLLPVSDTQIDTENSLISEFHFINSLPSNEIPHSASTDVNHVQKPNSNKKISDKNSKVITQPLTSNAINQEQANSTHVQALTDKDIVSTQSKDLEFKKKDITVTGTRQIIQRSIEEKRVETSIIDGLNSDDVAVALNNARKIPAQRTPRDEEIISIDTQQLIQTPIKQKHSGSRISEKISTTGASKTPSTSTQKQYGYISSDDLATLLERPDSDKEYANDTPNSIKRVNETPFSTFSIDVDTASYALVRNQLNNGLLPKPAAVRAEEFINYFDYNYPAPSASQHPFKTNVTILDSPWNKGKKLIHLGIKGYEIPKTNTPNSNIVFLLDVSGSMNAENKLPLVKQSINVLLDTLKPTDTVSIVVYAGAAGIALEPTQIKNKTAIQNALQRLNAGGSKTGAQGIKLAYQLAERHFNKDSVNRIVIATDGDFNIGQASNEDLKALVERKRDNGIFLSVLGFGRANYQDDMMQTLAQNGNGIAAYIDTLSEAKKVLVDEATSTLFNIAKDVKIQVEFNPETVSDYRLIGYETRALKREDFNNDNVDAGDIGSGHTVTAIYEITPTDSELALIDKPRYAANDKMFKRNVSRGEYGFLKIRYKAPTDNQSKLIERAINVSSDHEVSDDVQFSIAVAGFAQLLANNVNTGDLNYKTVIESAQQYKGEDEFGYRAEFIRLVRMAEIAKP